MAIRKMFVGSVLLFILALISAAQQVEIKRVPIKHVSPASGQEMYVSYCAACHGKDGRGDGPAATALKTPPPDLTVLTRNNSGKYPEMRVYNTVSGDAVLAAHGQKDMPVWGSLFISLCGSNPPNAEVHLRIRNITKYVESLQKD